MSKRSGHLTIESTDIESHPAAVAWHRFGGPSPVQVEVWRRVSRNKPAVYRLVFGNGHPGLFAKHSPNLDLALERALYQDILPHLPISVPRLHGYERDGDGTWMFIEDVGDQAPVAGDPEHRALAARWLARLHGSGGTIGAASRLPDAGPNRYLAHLRSGRATIREHLTNPWLATDDRPVLTGMIELMDRLESRWPAVERQCADMPVTLVHGDFRSKNVRIRMTDDGPALYALDWEMVGWGVPAADLAGAIDPAPIVSIDARAYAAAPGAWPRADAETIRRAAVLGRVFQALAATEWACASLVVASERHLIRPISSLRQYRGHLAEALAAGGEWLA